MTATIDIRRFAPDGSISQPPTRGEVLADRAFRALAFTSGALVVLLLAYILWKIGLQAGAGDGALRLRLPDHGRLEPGPRRVRRPRRDLGHALQLDPRPRSSPASSASPSRSS